MVLADLLVCGFSALRAEKPHTFEKERTALPKAQSANRLSPIVIEFLVGQRDVSLCST
jgi:hypothetical protein